MKQWTNDEFERMLKDNGYWIDRYNGSHHIFVNGKGGHISVPPKICAPIARRLIKENNLICI